MYCVSKELDDFIVFLGAQYVYCILGLDGLRMSRTHTHTHTHTHTGDTGSAFGANMRALLYAMAHALESEFSEFEPSEIRVLGVACSGDKLFRWCR